MASIAHPGRHNASPSRAPKAPAETKPELTDKVAEKAASNSDQAAKAVSKEAI